MEEYIAEKNIFEKYQILVSVDVFQTIKEVSLSELGFLTKNLNEFLTFHSASINDEICAIPKLSELIIKFGLVKTFEDSEDRDYESKDFPNVAENAEQCFMYLTLLLPYYQNISISNKRKFLIPVLLLCASHNKNYLWTNNTTVSLCKDFLKELLTCSNHKNLSHLLADDTFHPTIFKGILKWMRPSLMKDTWSRNPSSCHSFYWILSHIKSPHLVDYLSDVLPPSFMFSSYYAVPQQMLGIKCFDHILNNVPPSLLKANGTENAIFDALKVYLHSKEIPIIEVLYPCLLKLPMMNLKKQNQSSWLQFDVVLHQLLDNIDMESNPELRCLFLTQAHLFTQSIPCFKHLKKTLNLVYTNLAVNSMYEEKCRIISLRILRDLIKSCWPRMENHCFDIILAMLKVMSDIEYPSYAMDNDLCKELVTLCEECLYLLRNSCPATFEDLVNSYLEGEDSMPGFAVLKDIMLETT